jgi:predicted nuclease of restriction endonuclease-like (RecB) superfamily
MTDHDQEICYTVCSKLSWSLNRLIMRVEDPKARAYYLQEGAEQQWSVRQLERNIKTHSFERLLSTQSTPSESILPTRDSFAHLDFIKDPYVLEFLQLPEAGQIKERRLEQAIIDELQKFLLKLGKGFSFVARQMRISTETSHFFIDLVFYNYLLKCFVIVDLKTVTLSHQDIGQMDMYVRMFDDLKRGEDDNPTIGIILCDNKDETVVKYSVVEESQQLFASKYQRILPTEAEWIAEIEREKRMIEGTKD